MNLSRYFVGNGNTFVPALREPSKRKTRQNYIETYLPLLSKESRGEENLCYVLEGNKSTDTKKSAVLLCYFLFLVVYQKKYHFCLVVFQNISIFAPLLSSVTYEVTD